MGVLVTVNLDNEAYSKLLKMSDSYGNTDISHVIDELIFSASLNDKRDLLARIDWIENFYIKRLDSKIEALTEVSLRLDKQVRELNGKK